MLTNTVSARRTRNITQASEKFASSEKGKYEAWFYLYADFVDSGVKSVEKYAQGIAQNPHITTALPASQSEKVLGAMRNAFKKYGTQAKVQQAHAKWCKDNGYEYADISNFKKFAPAGQRAKSDASSTRPVITKMWRKEEFVNDVANDLVEQGLSRAEARKIAKVIADKRFIQK